jgi:hypothetical protein
MLRQPLRDRPGQPSRLSFRTQAPGAANELTTWVRSVPAPSASADRQQPQSSTTSYQAEHDHLFGSCSGRLIITQDQISYESVTNLDHSRQWAMKDIKELNRSSPYKIEIKPFTGDDYTFRLIGNGMSSEEYANLVKRVTAARSAQ